MANVFLFTGENTYSLDAEKQHWITEFRVKHGAENVSILQGDKLKLRELLDEVSTAPFIAEKRLVLLRGIPKLSKEETEVFLHSVHPSVILVLADPKPDKRWASTKMILESVVIKEFPLLSPKQLEQWLTSESSRLQLQLEPPARSALLALVGENQSVLLQELEKLSLLPQPVNADTVMSVVLPAGEQEIWKLSSLIAAGDRKGALGYIQSLLRQGEDPFSLWSILIWILRSLTSVVLALEEGHSQPAKVASLTQVPFPSVRTLQALAGKGSLQGLRTIHRRAAEAERLLKTGGYRSTGEAPQELLALIDTLVVDLCSLKTP